MTEGLADEVLGLRGVIVVRGGVTLLRGVDWTVREGERWAVLGPNGAGKTTLLQVAGAALRPSAGVVRVLGERVEAAGMSAHKAELRSRVGLASSAVGDRVRSTETSLELVVAAAYGTLRSSAEPDPADLDRARGLLARLGVAAVAGRGFGRLSEGERKRVLLARALMADPELLLLDEPAATLDLGGREALVRFLGRLAADQAAPAMAMVTHRVEEIPPNFSHVLLLRGGAVEAAGPIEETLTRAGLSRCFGFPLRLDRVGARWAATA